MPSSCSPNSPSSSARALCVARWIAFRVSLSMRYWIRTFLPAAMSSRDSLAEALERGLELLLGLDPAGEVARDVEPLDARCRRRSAASPPSALSSSLRARLGLLAQERDRDRVGAVCVRARAERARDLLLLLGVELLPARRSLERRQRRLVGARTLLRPRLRAAPRTPARAPRVLVDLGELAEERLALRGCPASSAACSRQLVGEVGLRVQERPRSSRARLRAR